MMFYNWLLWANRSFIKIKNLNRKVILKQGSHVVRGSTFEGENLIGRNTFFQGKIGRGSYIGQNCLIRGKVGRYCSIGNNVRTVIGIHPTEKFVSTHPCFFSTAKQAGFTYVDKDSFKEIKYADNEKNHIVIGNDVWIGEGVSIIGGVTIGDGAIIGACSLVNKDVPPYTIVGGVPAKKIRNRFSDEQVNALLKIRWWDFSESEILEQTNNYRDIDRFLEFYKKEEKT